MRTSNWESFLQVRLNKKNVWNHHLAGRLLHPIFIYILPGPQLFFSSVQHFYIANSSKTMQNIQMGWRVCETHPHHSVGISWGSPWKSNHHVLWVGFPSFTIFFIIRVYSYPWRTAITSYWWTKSCSHVWSRHEQPLITHQSPMLLMIWLVNLPTPNVPPPKIRLS